MNNLILLRHGQSQWNLENRFTGWEDVPLTEQGIAEAKALATCTPPRAHARRPSYSATFAHGLENHHYVWLDRWVSYGRIGATRVMYRTVQLSSTRLFPHTRHIFQTWGRHEGSG